MARVTVEDCIKKISNPFDLVLLATHRAKELQKGELSELDKENDKGSILIPNQNIPKDDRSLQDNYQIARLKNPSGEIEIESVDGTSVTLTPEENYNGTASVIVTVSDGELEDSFTFELIVTPVNDAPYVANPINDVNVDEDSDNIIIDLSTVFNDV